MRIFQPSEIMQALDRSIEKDVRKIGLVALRSLTLATPVGDPDLWAPGSLPPPPGYLGGRARGSWQVSIGSPETGTAVTDVKGQQRRDKSGSRTISRGRAEINKYAKRGRRFPKLFVQSNIPYMGRLNDGHSKQIARGWIDRAQIQAARSIGGRVEL